MEVPGDVVRLQGLPELVDEPRGGASRPRRQSDIADLGAAVPDAKVDAVEILEEVALVLRHVELGDELLEVGVVRRDVDPRLRHRVEHAVGVVEATVLQAQHALGDLRRGIGRSVVQGDPSAFVDIKTNVLSQYWVGRPLVPKVS